MHSHLHTAHTIGCEEVMNALDACHAKGFIWSSLGNCNDVKRAVNRCLGERRAEQTAKNREQAKKDRARIKKLFDEVDANS